MLIIAEFLEALGAWLTGFWDLVSDSLTASVAIFFDGTNLTVLGVLLLFSIAVGLVYLGLNFVTRLIHK